VLVCAPRVGAAGELGYGVPGIPHGCVHGPGIGIIVAVLTIVYPAQAEQVGVEVQGERAGCQVVHRPCGTDEVGYAALEEPFGVKTLCMMSYGQMISSYLGSSPLLSGT
jgi:hypothetical protein